MDNATDRYAATNVIEYFFDMGEFFRSTGEVSRYPVGDVVD
jgi:hypothetical protein